MTQKLNWEITDADRTKAQVKYELSHLKCRLRSYLNHPKHLTCYADEIIDLCRSIATNYLDYLRLFQDDLVIHSEQLSTLPYRLEHFESIFNLEQRLAQSSSFDVRKELILQIVALYQQVGSIQSLHYLQQMAEYAMRLKRLFAKGQLERWLVGIANFWSHHEATTLELAMWFHEWSRAEQKEALDFFAQEQFVDLVNAIFFYKLFPEKLFPYSVHPEKLISVRARLSVLHYSIELIQQQLHNAALQNGLIPEVDYLLHGNELPQGIMIEVNDSFKAMIWTAVKQLRITISPLYKQQLTVELLRDLGRAYKFWFNPNRLIDTAMVLRQTISSETHDIDVFQPEMMLLFAQLSTTECLDLYGYFANNDTRHLLHTFFILVQGELFDWLPPLREEEKRVLQDVFDTLLAVMQALRDELKNRHVLTEAYHYKLAKPYPQIGHRNRDAVLRVIAIYSRKTPINHDSVEQLFRFVEED
ncbi:hypothetical protein [Legionella rowbothamii]|uniref:hypothetical protein n=1 Tax=Legionella rowbothamii TaxID=96229 RepID=UPI0010566A5C|nr:hypothetical protein [Legionella rowbothamii]